MAYTPRQAPVVPPDKGSFPLDHEGACKPEMQLLSNCLKDHQGESLPCRELSIKYLQCRMDKGLMAKESLSSLGFNEVPEQQVENRQNQNSKGEVRKEKKGFVAGLEVKPVETKT